MSNTIIGHTLVIDGEIVGDESLTILGTVKGKIELNNTLLVEKEGNVEADMIVNKITINGSVTGNIHAHEKVEIQEAGQMVGDIKSPRIFIADGAVFKGQIDMDVD
ncbi:polymer-forming cytoskeletal protein [bacterium]|nr:polymer-forming cytoskeletal protein [bacterium]